MEQFTACRARFRFHYGHHHTIRSNLPLDTTTTRPLHCVYFTTPFPLSNAHSQCIQSSFYRLDKATCKQYDWWRGMGAEREDRFSYWLHKRHIYIGSTSECNIVHLMTWYLFSSTLYCIWYLHVFKTNTMIQSMACYVCAQVHEHPNTFT